MDKVTFFVAGRPRAQGSMKTFTNPKTGKPVFVPMSKYLKPWRRDVAWAANEALEGRMIYGGTSLTLIFTFERPKSHYRTGKYSHLLRDDAPERHLQDPDNDKLERAILDALTGIAYKDDNEVDSGGKLKRWGPRGGIPRMGVDITLRGVFCAVQRERKRR